jgi:predicted Zn-dependent peptidase
MNQEQFDSLRAQWRLAEDAAKRLGDPGEFGNILLENGASAVRLGATWHALQAGYTLPSNRLELWFAMESQRLMHPVLRDFETERSAAIEESAKMQGNGQTRVLDALLAAAFTAHPYRVPSIGWPTEIPELNRRQGRAFVQERYVPGNIVVAMAGDVDPAEAKRLAEKYFAAMPAKPMPPLVRTVEPQQQGPRTIQLDQTGQFLVAIGYKRPSYFDKDDAALDVLQAILSGTGSGGMAQRELVQDKKIAAALQISAAYPDGHDPSLFLFFIAPAPGQTVETVQRGVDELIGRVRVQKVGLDLLNQAKSQAQSAAYQRLAANGTMAEMLAIHTAEYGDPKKLFGVIDELGKVSEDDVMRVAQKYFLPSGRTTVYTAFPGMPVRATRTGAAQ